MSAASAAPSSYKASCFDIGGHRFFSKSKEVVDLWNEILPDDFIERPRLSRIYLRRQVLLLSAEGVRGAAQARRLSSSAACVLSYAYAKRVPDRGRRRTFHDWVRNQFGERLFSIFFKTYTEKVWGMSCDEISADWAAQRIKGLDLGVAVIERAASARSACKPQAAGRRRRSSRR